MDLFVEHHELNFISEFITFCHHVRTPKCWKALIILVVVEISVEFLQDCLESFVFFCVVHVCIILYLSIYPALF